MFAQTLKCFSCAKYNFKADQIQESRYITVFLEGEVKPVLHLSNYVNQSRQSTMAHLICSFSLKHVFNTSSVLYYVIYDSPPRVRSRRHSLKTGVYEETVTVMNIESVPLYSQRWPWGNVGAGKHRLLSK